MNNDKTIILPEKPKKEKIIEKKKRNITLDSRWTSNVSLEMQKKLLEEDGEECEAKTMIVKQIHQKIAGYKYQDLQNEIYSESKFVNYLQVVDLLKSSNLTCYYCQNPVQLLYEYVRESNQWTLERLDNKHGHNFDNVVIACLGCNLRRRTMYPERFLYTKQIGKQSIIKLNQ
jgi:5-methylcytosine-specific restriction endonuclease McrA